MEAYYGIVYSDEYLEHFGIKGQKWGIRRYQNDDGTLTDAGKARYQRIESSGNTRLMYKTRLNDLDKSRAENLRDYGDMQSKRNSLERKAKRAKTDEQHDQLRKKADEIGNEQAKRLNNLAKIDAQVNKYIADAKAAGYSVNGVKTNRNTVRGKSVALRMLAHLAVDAVTIPTIGFAAVPIGDKWVQGTKYKVSRNRSY